MKEESYFEIAIRLKSIDNGYITQRSLRIGRNLYRLEQYFENKQDARIKCAEWMLDMDMERADEKNVCFKERERKESTVQMTNVNGELMVRSTIPSDLES